MIIRALLCLMLSASVAFAERSVSEREAVAELSAYLRQLQMNCVTLVGDGDYIEACSEKGEFSIRQSMRFSDTSKIACHMSIVFVVADQDTATYRWDVQCPPDFPLGYAEKNMELHCAQYFRAGLRHVFNWMYMMKFKGRPA